VEPFCCALDARSQSEVSGRNGVKEWGRERDIQRRSAIPRALLDLALPLETSASMPFMSVDDVTGVPF
jgi:hypothetical protein